MTMSPGRWALSRAMRRRAGPAGVAAGAEMKQRPKTRLGCPRLTSAIDCPGVPYAVIGIACPP